MIRSLHGVRDWFSRSEFVPPTTVSLDEARVLPGHDEREALRSCCVIGMMSLHPDRMLVGSAGSLLGVWQTVWCKELSLEAI